MTKHKEPSDAAEQERIIVTFRDVGRAKATFSVNLPRLDYHNMRRAVRPHLMSRDVDFSVTDGGNCGQVIVGGMRVVGEFTWTNAPTPSS